MGSKILILGNGFDLDLGLKTRYSDFWSSTLWTQAKNQCQEPYLVKSLERYRVTHHWFDLESGLEKGAFSLNKKLGTDFDNTNYLQSFQLLKDKLKLYIQNQQSSFSPPKNCVAEYLLREITYNGAFRRIYTFNYTDLKYLASQMNVDSLPDCIHVHGSLESGDDIILGIETEDFKSIPEQLTFLIKSNSQYYRNNSLLDDITNADEVIFFGHSINGMDFPYFKEYFRMLSQRNDPEEKKRRVTIITYDETSSSQIKDNMRFNGIDVRTLYNRVKLDFILTKDINDGSDFQTKKLSNLLHNLKSTGFISRY